MSIDGYRYWVERHKLLVELAEARDRLAGRPDADRDTASVELDRQFRERLDALYGQARDQFEGKREKN